MTLTVKQLREELLKFRDDAVCYAYEGEVCGIVISPPGKSGGPSVIHCGEGKPQDPPRSEVDRDVARASRLTGKYGYLTCCDESREAR